jgi:hypothetical protein
MPKRIQRPHHIFGPMDELGMLMGLQRLPGERNNEYRNRIAGYYKGSPSATHQGMVNAISSELGLLKYNVIGKKLFWLEHVPDVSGTVTVYVEGSSY